jgi:hypothetical protein
VHQVLYVELCNSEEHLSYPVKTLSHIVWSFSWLIYDHLLKILPIRILHDKVFELVGISRQLKSLFELNYERELVFH